MSSGTPSAARLMNALSMVILSGATFAVLLAATPAIVRAAAGSPPPRLSAALSSKRARAQPTQLPAAPGPRFDPRDRLFDDDDGPVGDIDSPPGAPKAPKLWDEPPSGADRERGASDDPRAPTAASPREGAIRTAIARANLELRDGPRESGVVIGEIKAGEQVVLIRESGAWALVVHSGEMGWAPKSEITLR